MYPPKPSQNPQEWLNNLWASLQRGGHHFGSEASLEQGSDGSIRLRSRMNERLPDTAKRAVTAYMKQYAKESGWRLKVAFKKGYVELEAASKDASSSSKKA